MISVCIPTYNGEKYIKEQLKSILLQLEETDEIIISDDCSTDSTIEIISSFKDSRIKIFKHEKIYNPYKGTYSKIYTVYRNVENALNQSCGDYIFLCDQDDIWLPNKIPEIMSSFNQGNELILHNNIVIDNDYNIILNSYFSHTRPRHSFIQSIINCPFQGSSMAFSQTIKKLSLPFPDNPISHDHWISYNAIYHRKCITFIEKPLMLYRRHENNVSPSSEKSKNSLWFKISYRFYSIFAYILLIFRQ